MDGFNGLCGDVLEIVVLGGSKWGEAHKSEIWIKDCTQLSAKALDNIINYIIIIMQFGAP
jgi:hypothetical protein